MKNGKRLSRGCLKDTRKTYPCNIQTEKRKKGELTYIAVDSNIICDMKHVLNHEYYPKKLENYYKQLKRLLSCNVFNSDGSRNPKGRYVLCVLPSVLEEILNAGEINSSLKEFIKNRTLIISIDQQCKTSFNQLVEKLVNGYTKDGYFIDNDKRPTKDAYIVAEASIFNLTLLSQDRHIIKNYKEQYPEKKIEQIKQINKRYLIGDFNGNLAEPRRLDNFFNLLSKGKPMPPIENISVLDKKTKTTLCTSLQFQSPKHKKFDLVRNF